MNFIFKLVSSWMRYFDIKVFFILLLLCMVIAPFGYLRIMQFPAFCIPVFIKERHDVV
jgi:hypothetical protein